MKLITVKMPEGMLELWDQFASKIGKTRSQLIRDSVNKEIGTGGTPFDSTCRGASNHTAGVRCRFCRGDN